MQLLNKECRDRFKTYWGNPDRQARILLGIAIAFATGAAVCVVSSLFLFVHASSSKIFEAIAAEHEGPKLRAAAYDSCMLRQAKDPDAEQWRSVAICKQEAAQGHRSTQ